MDIVVWLRSLSLDRYEAAFRDNEIDETVLPNLTAGDLKDLGVGIVGHRRKILDAIAVLATIVGQCKSSSARFLVRWCASKPTTQATPCPALVPIHARSGSENV
jgi:hypothetical protein